MYNMEPGTKLKDLPPGTNLGNLKIKTPKGVVGYWKSQWQAGVWLTNGESDQIYPQFVNQLTDCKEWELTDESVNCHIRTDLDDIDNSMEEGE